MDTKMTFIPEQYFIPPPYNKLFFCICSHVTGVKLTFVPVQVIAVFIPNEIFVLIPVKFYSGIM